VTAVTWPLRVLAVAAVALLLWLLRYLGAGFHPASLLALAVAVCVLAWVATDLSDGLRTARWEGPPGRTQMNRGRDFRLAYLTRLLGEDDLHEAHRVLVRLTDQILLGRYGVSRAAQPDRARAILGRDLDDFLAHAPVASPHDYHHRLPAALSRIEDL